MSPQKPKIRPYNHDEINRKIIARQPKVYPEGEMLGIFGRYRDQNMALYEQKKAQFLETATAYRRNNEMALIQNKIRLGRFADDVLNYHFEQPVEEEVQEVDEDKGLMLRRRTDKHAYECSQPELRIHCIEPWFKRYLILCKFIWAARTVILNNRLLKNLEKLKALSQADVDELERNYRKHANVSYADLFNSFEEC